MPANNQNKTSTRYHILAAAQGTQEGRFSVFECDYDSANRLTGAEVKAEGSLDACMAAKRLLSMFSVLVCLVLATNASADAPKPTPKPVCEKPVNGVSVCRVGAQQYQCTTTPDGKVTSCFPIDTH